MTPLSWSTFNPSTPVHWLPSSRYKWYPFKPSPPILVVEDNEGVRTLIAEILKEHGYRVIEASNGEEAILRGRAESTIHLLITDVIMPRLGGADVAKQFATIHPETRLIFSSGYTDDAVLRHGIRHSEVAFLQKPFTRDSLVRLVRSVLDSKPDEGRLARAA